MDIIIILIFLFIIFFGIRFIVNSSGRSKKMARLAKEFGFQYTSYISIPQDELKKLYLSGVQTRKVEKNVLVGKYNEKDFNIEDIDIDNFVSSRGAFASSISGSYTIINGKEYRGSLPPGYLSVDEIRNIIKGEVI